MTPIASYAAGAAAWQNFYLLVGAAAATLIGLMFLAITFCASLVNPETAAQARAFLDPVFSHFVQVLFTACLIAIPTMFPSLLGVLLLVIAALRGGALVGVFRHMREAHRRVGDLELSDWLSGIVVPAASHLVLAATGAAFLAGWAIAFSALAAVCVVVLLNGIFGAWELMLWLAVAHKRTG